MVWGTSIPRETAEEIDAFLKKHGYTKVKLIEEGYKSLLEQAGEINIDLAKITDGLKEEKNNNKNVTKLKYQTGGFLCLWRENIVSIRRENIVSAQ